MVWSVPWLFIGFSHEEHQNLDDAITTQTISIRKNLCMYFELPFVKHHCLSKATIKNLKSSSFFFFFEAHITHFHGAFSNPKTDRKKKFHININKS